MKDLGKNQRKSWKLQRTEGTGFAYYKLSMVYSVVLPRWMNYALLLVGIVAL